MKKASVIEELFDSNMWMKKEHVELLHKKQEEENLSDEDILEIVEKNSESAKRSFKKVFKRMGDKKDYYRIPNILFPVGKTSAIIVACKYKFQRLVGQYKAVIIPFYNYDCRADEPYSAFSTVIDAKDNKIVIPFRFESEDMYIVNVFYLLDGEELLLLSARVYALESDLYELNYYKADFHMHTTHSDGYEPPELVALSAREHGMDIIAVTDHNAFSGSVVAREKVAEMGVDMTVILGEEYSLEYNPMHILCLGAEEEIEKKYLTKQVLDMDETRQIIENSDNLSCDPRVYAGTQVLLDQVSKIGGISILAHPYWKPISADGTRMDTPENLFIELCKDRRFTGIEIVSGSQPGEVFVANLQSSFCNRLLGVIEGFPIIGITDSHFYTSDPICGDHFTIVFARSRSSEHVIEALKNGLTVAVELVNGVPLCYGNHRLIKLAEFLIGFYFPQRDIAAREEALNAKLKYLINNDG